MALRIFVTALGVAIYRAGGMIHLPFLDFADFHLDFESVVSRATFRAVGLDYFVAGFVVVELFSLLTPWGRRLRMEGATGRAKLNRAALATGSALVLFQARVTATYLLKGETPTGAPVTEAPALVLFATLAAASFAALGLAGLLSRWGLGNGLVVLFASDKLADLLYWVWFAATKGLLPDPEYWLMSTLLTAGLAALLILLYRRPREFPVTGVAGERLLLRVPTLPQGVLPVTGTWLLMDYLFQPQWGAKALLEVGRWGYYSFLPVAIALLSVLAAWMFSSWKRVQGNLSGLVDVPEEEYRRAWLPQLLLTASLLLVVETAETLNDHFLPDAATIMVTLAGAVVLVALGFDLYEEGRLLAKAGPLVRIQTLDNVHLAEYLRARFESNGISCVVRAYHFRHLGYFFASIFKMALLIPAGERERALRLLEETPLRIV